MKVIGNPVDTHSADYQQNLEQMLALNEELDKITAQTMDVGDKMRAVAKKRDKLLPRERIEAVLDKGSPFLEVG